MADADRTAMRDRYTAAYHEAGHVTAGYILGQRVASAEIAGVGELLTIGEGKEVGGFVMFADHEVSTLGEAIDDMAVSLAGEAAVRVAWALETLDEVTMALDEIPTMDMPLDKAVTIPNGSTPTQRAAHGSYQSSAAASDVHDAEAMAAEWTESGMAAAALTGFVHAYVADMVAGERFQFILARVAAALLEVGSLSGELANDLLHRYDLIFKPTGGTHGSNGEVA